MTDTSGFFFVCLFPSCAAQYEHRLTHRPQENLLVFKYVMKGLTVTLAVYMAI